MSDITQNGNAHWQNCWYQPPSDALLRDMRQRMTYDFETGAVKWAAGHKPRRRNHDGLVGTVRSDGYRYYQTRGKAYPISRIAFFLATGDWPKGVVRFLDGDPSNFRLGNLCDWGAVDNTPEAALTIRQIEEETQKQRALKWDRESAHTQAENGLWYYASPAERERAIQIEIRQMAAYAESSRGRLFNNGVPEAERRAKAEARADADNAPRDSVDRELKRLGVTDLPADDQAAFRLLLALS